MKFLKAFFKKIARFPSWFARSRWNKVITVMAVPGLIIGYLLIVFLGGFTNVSSYVGYGKAKDNDKAYNGLSEADIVFLDQGWDDRYRNRYYYTPQGSYILPLDIALNLEMPNTQNLIFADDGPVIKQYRYLAYQSDTLSGKLTKKLNIKTPNQIYPDSESLKNRKLPIGFTVDGTPKNPMLGINCAACHTSNLSYKGKTIRVEGGAAMGDFMGLFGALDDSLVETLKDQDKLIRLAKRINEDEEVDLDSLRQRLLVASAERQAWQRRNSDTIPTDAPHGHGRVDAFGVIFNQVLGRDLGLDFPAPADDIVDGQSEAMAISTLAAIHGNVRVPDAPVSYPVLWDTPFMGRVQWNGSANNVSRGGVLGRNTGQVLGVFGQVDVTENNILPGYCSTVKRENLQLFDYWIQSLKSPKWEDAAEQKVLPPLSDQALIDKGFDIYHGKKAYKGLVKIPGIENNCSSCHSIPSDNYRDKPFYQKESCELPITLVQSEYIGTDPNTAKAGVRQGAFSGRLGGKPTKKDPDVLVQSQEQKLTLLKEVVSASIAGSFQPVTCRGDFSISALTDSWNGFGKLARGKVDATISKEESANSAIYDSISGGYAAEADTRIDECANTAIRRDLTQDEIEKGLKADPYKLTFDADAYRARPLTGIWASAPYLHNGSVPTLYDLLIPPRDLDGNCPDPEGRCRPVTFHVGSTEFDPIHVGFQTEAAEHTTMIDTRLSGNLNTGHNFVTGLSHEERLALLEYLKTL